MIRRPAIIIVFIMIFSAAGRQTPISLVAATADQSPCLSPSPSDYANQPLNPGPTSVTMQGHVIQSVKNHEAVYKGELLPNQILNLEFVFKIRNYDSFTACLASIDDPASHNFRNFLNSTTLAPYAPLPSPKASVASFFRSHGLNVTDGASPLVLMLAGTAQQVASLFNVKLEVFSQGNAVFYSPTSDPTLPQNFAGLASSILGLDNYTRIHAAEFPCYGPYCPQGVQVGYSLTSLYSDGFNGAGVNVAIVDAPGDPDIQNSIDTFDKQYTLPKAKLTLVYPDGVPINPTGYDTGWAREAALDVEAVHTVAPGAGIVLLYDKGDLPTSIDYVATHHLASIVSNSWTFGCPDGGDCSDTELGSNSTLISYDQRFALDAAQGLTIVFASGDRGSRPGTVLGTEFPASDPNVLAVGATDLILSGCGSTSCLGYVSETGASISGGGYSGAFPEPAWQYSSLGATPFANGRPGRGVPDVSMFGLNPGFWVYSAFISGWFSEAGTSLSTPLWAGFLAIATQIRGGPLGNIDPVIYNIGTSASHTSLFHDIVAGLNGDYSAGPGWDPVTGWGTPVADSLAPFVAFVTTLTVSYTIVDGGNPSAPVLSYVFNNTALNYTLTTIPSTISIQVGSSWSVTNPLAGSTNYERWYTNQATGMVSGPRTVNFVYRHQAVVQLRAGWNLISLPLVPDDSSIASILARQVANKTVSIVWAYSANTKTWQSFNPQLDSLPLLSGKRVFNPNTLSTMTDGKGYWIYMFSSDFVFFNGSVIPTLSTPPSYQLSKGWNLVGYKPQPSVQNETVSQYLISISGNYDPNNVWVYNNLTSSWTRGGPSTQLFPGEAMWILMTSSAALRP